MKVELLSSFGDDTMIANVARVSYAKEAANYSEEQNNKLLKFLAEHNHWSPFSHPQVQFRLEIPIYVERQLVKSEAGRVYNSISGRYVDFSDTYSLIGIWRKQSVSSKQGSAEDLSTDIQEECNDIEHYLVEHAKKAYQQLIDMGVSKEQARTVLPLSLNTTMIWTGSLYTFIRVCKQRLKPDAQQETRMVVQEMLDALKASGKFNESLKLYNL
jgi:thymidylate synthase (FAD)